MSDDKGVHYRFEYKGINLDPARIALVYEITHPIQFNISKKALCTGRRGKKSTIEDLEDIITGCKRWIEMIKEDWLVPDGKFALAFDKELPEMDGFKSKKELLAYFNANYDLEEMKTFHVYRWKWEE